MGAYQMILRKLLHLHGIDTKKLNLHPGFDHFDRLVTVLVFVDLAPKAGNILHALGEALAVIFSFLNHKSTLGG